MSVATYLWTPDRLARARGLLAEGLSYSQAASRMGTTKGALQAAIRKADGRKRPDAKPDAAPATQRPCLRCRAPMRSTGPHHRLCDPCRSGNGLPHDWQVAAP